MTGETYKALLKDLQKLQKRLVEAHVAAVRADAGTMERLAARHVASETGGQLNDFVLLAARKSAVQFLLRTVYVRVLEDLGALEPVRFRGGWGEEAFRAVAPALGKRAYFAFVFRDLAVDFPALFTPGPDELDLPEEDLCREVWRLWHEEDGRGNLRYDWRAPENTAGDEPDTSERGGFESRFLGDLYQDLDAEVRKRYALLQTPVFVERYILDKTLTPALVEFDPEKLRADGETFRVLDPTCGSGHFLVGAFHRMADYWEGKGLSKWDAAASALESVWGSDINPHAVDIARFRLLLEVRGRTGVNDLDRLSGLTLNLRVLDSLIPWERASGLFPGMDRLAHYATPEERAENAKFLGRAFHVVVGNPPYITPKDVRKRDDYRAFWPDSCHKEYALSGPYIERFYILGTAGAWMGQITADSFVRRSFGAKVVEKVLPKWDLHTVVDASLAPIPGHGWKGGTPTVLLFGRSRRPSGDPVRVLVAKRGEPEAPEPGREHEGYVWRAICNAPATDDDSDPHVGVRAVPLGPLCRHPWSLGGDGASRVKQLLDASPRRVLGVASSVGLDTITRASELVELSTDEIRRSGVERSVMRPYPVGDDIRDYTVSPAAVVPIPYDVERGLLALSGFPGLGRFLWPHRNWLSQRFISGGTRLSDVGLPHHAIPQYPKDKHKTPWAIAYAFMATHNHFAFDRSALVYKQTAPIIKLRAAASEADHLELLASLSSSCAAFWLRTVCQGKGQSVEPFIERLEYDAAKVRALPLPTGHAAPRIALAEALDATAQQRAACLPAAVLAAGEWSPADLRARLDAARERYRHLTHVMVALQEELDWLTYGSYNLIDPPVDTVGPDAVEPLAPGHRPFEILFARADDEADAEEKSSWWSHRSHGHDRVTEVPAHYSAAQRARIEARMARIEEDARLQLLEAPAYKRRWQTPDLAKAEKEAAESWLLDRLEDLFAPTSEQSNHAAAAELSTPRPYRLEAVVAAWQRDARVAAVAGVWSGAGAATDLTTVAEKLLRANALPDNPYRVYTAEGLRKLDEWKRVWALQDQEDAGVPQLIDPRTDEPLRDPATGDVTNTIPLPPKFDKNDFQSGYFATRGKLNVPRERFVLFAELTPPMYGWNGWRDRERALAQVEAYSHAETHPTDPLPTPTSDDPRRCGPTLGLWESLPDVKRWAGADEHGELQALAREVCKQDRCPCPVVERWQAWRSGALVLGGAADMGADAASGTRIAAPVADAVTVEERGAVMALFDKVQTAFLAGQDQYEELPLSWLHDRWKQRGAADKARLAAILDDLVATGDLGVEGKGARRKYRRAR